MKKIKTAYFSGWIVLALSAVALAMTVNENVAINGTLTTTSFSPPASCISDGNIVTPAAAANGINTIKLNHRERCRLSQAEGTATTSQTNIVLMVHGTIGSVVSFEACNKVACLSPDTVTVDLKKNGTSVLTSPITFNSSTPIMTLQTATVSVPACAVGDVFEIVITPNHTSGTLGQGVYAEGIIDEFPS